ncbi:MAG: hypothetical protein ACK438_11380 [Flavobacteriales bacterium]|jgi:hypothetical protein
MRLIPFTAPMNFKNVVFATLLLVLNGCIKNNPDPSWLTIDKWTLSANPNLSGNEGELSQNISEAWIYVNDQCLGVFELPVKIPVLKSGPVNVKVYPGIKNNGVSATKKIYPFLKVYESNITLVPNQNISLSPSTQYVENTNFIIEDFEGANINLVNDPNSSIANYLLDNIDLQPFNGNAYARVQLNQNDSLWVAYTTFSSYLPKGKEVYLELDYYTTNHVVTGLLAISPSGIKRNINYQLNRSTPETVKWKKIYIDLRELIGASDANAYFDHSFEAFKPSDLDQTEIRIDNIKVVYFQ